MCSGVDVVTRPGRHRNRSDVAALVHKNETKFALGSKASSPRFGTRFACGRLTTVIDLPTAMAKEFRHRLVFALANDKQATSRFIHLSIHTITSILYAYPVFCSFLFVPFGLVSFVVRCFFLCVFSFRFVSCLVRGLESRMTTFTWPLLARNVPFKRSSSSSSNGSSGEGVIVGVGEGGNNNNATEAAAASAVVPSLSHEVCHRLLKERFLKDTSYVDAEESSEGLGRALKALDVLLENEDDLLEVIAFVFGAGGCYCRCLIVVATVVACAFYWDCCCRWGWGIILCGECVAKMTD